MRKRDHENLKTLAALCGSVALIIAVAVFLSGGQNPNDILARDQIAPTTQTAGFFSSLFSAVNSFLQHVVCPYETWFGSCSNTPPPPPPPPPCSPNWSCSGWSQCSQSGSQSRTCTDLNSCGAGSGEPPTSQSCTPPPPQYCSTGVCGLTAGYSTLLGDEVQLSWSCNPSMYQSSRGDAAYSTGGALSGVAHVAPTSDTTYQLACISDGTGTLTPGSTFGNASVKVIEPTLKASAPTRVHKGSYATLSWDIENLSSTAACSLSSVPAGILSASWGGAGTAWVVSNQETEEPLSTQTSFTISCQAAGESFSTTTTVGLIPEYQEQ